MAHRRRGLARRETVAGLPEADGDNALQPRSDGRYLVTGAFGGAGKHLVEHLIDDCGCRNLVLMRRRALTPDDEDHRWVAGLRERSGATIQLLVADLAAAEVDGAWLTAHAGALDGIFHLAGATADRNILDTDAAQLDTVLGAKLRGASVLHDYACGQPSIGFIVYFVAGVAGRIAGPDFVCDRERGAATAGRARCFARPAGHRGRLGTVGGHRHVEAGGGARRRARCDGCNRSPRKPPARH